MGPSPAACSAALKGCVGRAITLAAVVLTAGVSASAQMPDVRQMSGMPLPVSDAAPGSVSVRVVRGALTNAIPNQAVELIGGASPVTQTTNEAGRAEFTSLTPGTRVKAVAVVDGERIESQEFEVPRNAGIRLLLVASDPGGAVREPLLQQAPAQPGTVVFGGESRFVFEVGDDGLNVFNLLQVVNTQKTPVQTAPLVFELPEAALRATVLQGSSQQAVAAGSRVTVTGPFAPGATNVEFAYTLDLSAREMTIRQTLPAALPQVTVLMQRVGEMHMTSPQFSCHRDMTAEGQAYILGQGPALKAGDTLAIELTGVPARATWPRNLALALATLLLAGGAWLAARPRAADDAGARAKQLNARRERLFEKLTELEKQRERLDAERYAERRRELVDALERVYAELDGQAA
jgi:hypothetical protein